VFGVSGFGIRGWGVLPALRGLLLRGASFLLPSQAETTFNLRTLTRNPRILTSIIGGVNWCHHHNW